MRGRAFGGTILIALGFWLPASAQPRGFEVTLLGGYAWSRTSGTSSYKAEWSVQALESLRAETGISARPQAGLELGVNLGWLPSSHFGLQLSASQSGPAVSTGADFHFNWKLAGQPAVEENHSWTGAGRLSSLALSLDLVARLGLGPTDISISAGPSLSFNSFEASTYAGLGASFIVEWWELVAQFVDAFQVPLRIAGSSWTAIGANLGLSLGVRLAGPLSLTLDGRYYFCPAKELSWKWQTGSYTGLANPGGYFSNWELSEGDLAGPQAATSGLEVNPSRFVMAAGLRLRFR